ncbi:hypothetical protein FBU59_000358 [Linderina macrospora]|uniref:Uncharacterized protein n=1 Tax=Linderina macrospora TaxID=4868 RepID=A0ACC1JHA2_9FUNG|nr:hypothetical protein FBU59_000358 [Linderina macrospora]
MPGKTGLSVKRRDDSLYPVDIAPAGATDSLTKKQKQPTVEVETPAKTRAIPARRASQRKPTPPKEAPAKKAPAKKTPPKKAAATKTPAKKAAAKKAEATTKAPAKKRAVRKPAAAAPAPVPVVPAEPKLPEPMPFLKARTEPMHALATRPTGSGNVFVFGNGDCGQLGLTDDVLECRKPHPLAALDAQNVVDIVSGGLHTVAIDTDGKLWSWGCNDQKALGRGGDEYVVERVEGLDKVPVAKIACSDSASFALSDDGHVYSWGTFRSADGIMGFNEGVEIQGQPMVINEFREPIVDLCAGVDHAIGLAASGKVYAWGYGQQGQLGRLIIERRRKHGLVPERLRVEDITHIGSGSYHSFAVTKTGEVLAWGLNNFHQLGLRPEDGGNEEIVHNPTKVAALAGIEVVKISGGEHHSVALSKDGKLYSFGRSDSSQTGLPFDTLDVDMESSSDVAKSEHKKAITLPTLIEGLPKIVDFVCGSNHNIALAEDGTAYMWGYGEMDQLGFTKGEDLKQPTPLPVKLIGGKLVIKAAAGGQHSVILAKKPEGVTGEDAAAKPNVATEEDVVMEHAESEQAPSSL